MAPKKTDAVIIMSLPSSVVSRIDVSRLAREVEELSSLLDQQQLHDHKGAVAPSRLSGMLGEMVAANKIDFDEAIDRKRLYDYLVELKSDAPRLHISFATEPSTIFTSKLITWLRSEIHPLLLLDIGLQPTIAAGCIIRTTNKIIDCSMRQHLLSNRPELLDRIRKVQHA